VIRLSSLELGFRHISGVSRQRQLGANPFRTRFPTYYCPAMPFETDNFISEGLSSSELSHFKIYHPSGNLILNNLGIFRNLKFRNLMGKIPPLSLKLNFTPNTLG